MIRTTKTTAGVDKTGFYLRATFVHKDPDQVQEMLSLEHHPDQIAEIESRNHTHTTLKIRPDLVSF